MPTNKELKNNNKRNEVACFFGFLAIFFISALVGAAIEIGFTHVIKRFAFTNSLKTETIAQADSRIVLGEKDFQIAQAAPFFDCAKVPYASSPACKGEHPRLYLTKGNIDEIRNKIRTVYLDDFQKIVTEADKRYSSTLDYTGIQYFAFLYQMGDTVLGQFTHQHTAADYGWKAKADLVAAVNAMLASGNIPSPTPDIPNPFLLGASVGYDWLFDLLSVAEKTTIARAFSLTIPNMQGWAVTPLDHSGNGIGSRPRFLCALAYYGDGYDDTMAQKTLDSFYGEMLGGGTISLKDIAASDDGGDNGGFSYLVYFFHSLGLVSGAWSSATGENIFAMSSYFRYFPYYVAYSVKPYSAVTHHEHHQKAVLDVFVQNLNLRIGQSFYKNFDPDIGITLRNGT